MAGGGKSNRGRGGSSGGKKSTKTTTSKRSSQSSSSPTKSLPKPAQSPPKSNRSSLKATPSPRKPTRSSSKKPSTLPLPAQCNTIPRKRPDPEAAEGQRQNKKQRRGGDSPTESLTSLPPSLITQPPSIPQTRPLVTHRRSPTPTVNQRRSPTTTVDQRRSPTPPPLTHDDESDDDDEAFNDDEVGDEEAPSTGGHADDWESEEEDEEAGYVDSPESEGPPVFSSEDERITLEEMLKIEGRKEYLTVLHPTPLPNTTWFGRDKGSLTRKISRILKNKFDGLYTSWTKVPLDRQRRYFVEFAQTHHWDLSLTDQVRLEFEVVCLRRMKGMVSTARRSRIRPRWITKTLWKQLRSLWKTNKAKKRSQTASAARNSPRNGLGPHKHLSGQKSYQQIQDEMEIELGRPVTYAEVFMRTHTRADGSFVDLKVQEIGKAYETILKSKLSEAELEFSETEDGTPPPPPTLTIDEQNSLFLQSTTADVRGNHFGLGSLNKTQVNGKRKRDSSSAPAFVALQEQLEDAQRRIDEQAAANARREAEIQAKMSLFDVLASYMRQKDPAFMEYLAAHSLQTMNAATSNSPPQ